MLEPFEKAGVYKGISAGLEQTQAALYSDRTAAAHVTGALQTYEAILWGPGVRSPCTLEPEPAALFTAHCPSFGLDVGLHRNGPHD